jgi:O-antigen ligase
MLIGAVCLLYLFARLKRPSHRLTLTAAAAGTLAVMFMYFSDVGDIAQYRLFKLFDTERSMENRTSGRSNLARAGWYIFTKHPLGVGTGGFGPEFAGLHSDEFEGRDVGAHSAWVRTLAENGVIGALVFAAYVFSFAVTALEGRRSPVRSLGLLVCLMLASAFISRDFHSKGLWFSAACYAALTSARYAKFRGNSGFAVTRAGVLP